MWKIIWSWLCSFEKYRLQAQVLCQLCCSFVYKYNVFGLCIPLETVLPCIYLCHLVYSTRKLLA